MSGFLLCSFHFSADFPEEVEELADGFGEGGALYNPGQTFFFGGKEGDFVIPAHDGVVEGEFAGEELGFAEFFSVVGLGVFFDFAVFDAKTFEFDVFLYAAFGEVEFFADDLLEIASRDDFVDEFVLGVEGFVENFGGALAEVDADF